jgi:ubiquinone/menaquinone biosynthesis C-methylase UbiE
MSHAANQTQHNPSNYSTHASFVYSSQYTNAVLSLLDAKPGEKIADLGCGTGELTRGIMEVVGEGGTVVGIDSNQSMVSERELSVSM